MFKALSHLHSKILLAKRRKRFNNVLGSGIHERFGDINIRLQVKDPTLTDDEILSEYNKFSNAIQTNTFAAAELEWVAVSIPCYYRPHLTKQLIKGGLLSIVYSIGDEIDSDTVIEFIAQRILAKKAYPYGGLPPEEGITWLMETLPQIKEIIQSVLENVIEENERELNGDN